MEELNVKMLLAQKELKNKTRLYILHVLFGWSYGSLGKAGLQALFYVISFIGWFVFWTFFAGITEEAESIDQMFLGIFITFFITQAWWIIRLCLLSGVVNKYNRKICTRYNLTDEQMKQLGIN